MSKRGKYNFSERVKAGAALLDARKPGWDTNIRLDRLALEDGTACVIGQVYGEYTSGVKELFGLEQRAYGGTLFPAAEALGFILDDAVAKQYHRLTQAWRRFLTKRRGN